MYDSTSKSFWYHDGSQWQEIGNANNSWKITGNAGTNLTVNFIGTIDNSPLLFRTNNNKAGYIYFNSTGNTGFGYQTLNSVCKKRL